MEFLVPGFSLDKPRYSHFMGAPVDEVFPFISFSLCLCHSIKMKTILKDTKYKKLLMFYGILLTTVFIGIPTSALE